MNNIHESFPSQKVERLTNPEEVTWECPTCGIQKPHSYTLKSGTYYGKRKCACQIAEEERMKKEKERQEMREFYGDRIYSWLGSRWTETTLRKKTFENFEAERQPHAYQAAKVFADEPYGTLILHGTFGTGKTHLLAAICNETLIKQNRRSLFTTSTKLFAAMQQKISDHADYYQIVEQAIKTPLLVIDDIDKAKWSEWREEQYFAIIDERIKHERPTAISTNRLDELDKFVGGAVCSRLQVGQIAIPMNGADYRKEM
jgi:DNA replication protein DnaC